MTVSEPPRADEAAVELVLALCHEIGNVVGAIRLHAHLLDPELSPREINQASVELDDLSARSSDLLMQIRPVLRGDPVGAKPCDPAMLLAELEDALQEHGGRGATLEVGSGAGLPRVGIEASALRALLSGFAHHAIEASAGQGFVRLSAERRDGAVVFSVEDGADPGGDLADWRSEARRGRPLQCAVSAHILERLGGGLEVGRHDGVTRVALIVPIQADV